jgi:fructose-1,6-bisphosphatase/inositol monophosphatase family enzyme
LTIKNELKDLAHKIIDNVYKKIRLVNNSDFYRFGNNMGLGADGTITKYIDKIAEDVAIHIILKSNKKVNLLSEEAGYIDNDGEYTFVLDPIDGTRNAYRGIPFYSISLAIGRKCLSDIEYGLVKNIPTGDLFKAEKTKGAFYNKNQIVVPNIPDKHLLSSLALGRNFDKYTLRLAKKEKVRSLGSSALEICMVAIGALDYYVVGKEYLRIVDIAAATLILREAGGVITNIKGDPLEMDFSLDERSSVVAACSNELIEKILKK